MIWAILGLAALAEFSPVKPVRRIVGAASTWPELAGGLVFVIYFAWCVIRQAIWGHPWWLTAISPAIWMYQVAEAIRPVVVPLAETIRRGTFELLGFFAQLILNFYTLVATLAA